MSLTRSCAYLASLCVLAACGGETEEREEPGREFPLTTDSINLEEGARHGGRELLWAIDQVGTQSPRLFEIPADLATTRGLFASDGPFLVDCNPVVTGYDGDTLRDTDGDGIPDDYKVDYGTACVSQAEVGAVLRITISGYRRLQDTGLGFRSYKVTVKDLVLLVEYLNTGAVHRTVLNGIEEGSFAPGGATYSSAVTIEEFTSHPADPDREWFRHVDLDLHFTPEAGHSLALGAPLPAGAMTLGGTMQHIEPDLIDRVYYTFELDTPTPLQWAPGCNEGDFTGGTLRGRYNGGNDVGFHINWTGCATLHRELFGY